ncbi:proteoglycan 4a [Misgurnus anguillicaudatus]|uniref:proteoglycan 4a n=1 Tax=Misgurnus anguillicaudatus TaxID=75329 RepID=UPI003CCF5FE1
MTEFALVSSLVALLCVLLQLCAAQGSCRDRCGEPFARSQICNCDHSCFVYGECCKDFEEVCTTSGSCRGRCGEAFLRGRECNCDSDCVLYNTCCSDYHAQCDAFSNPQAARSSMLNKPTDYTDQCMASCLATQQSPDLRINGPSALNFMSQTDAPAALAGVPVALSISAPMTPSDVPATGSNSSGVPLPDLDPTSGPSSGQPLIIPVQASLSINEQGNSTLEGITQAMGASTPAGLDASLNPDICSSLPIDGLATLFNGTIIIFKGHYFWLLNPKTRRVGPARNITEELGIPSPIDTAFTRCNCQGKTYIIKGENYWVFENGVMESGSPRSVSKDFGGLTGEITAALSIPAFRKRTEIVYFFKKGGVVQKFSYPPGSGPTCPGKRSKDSVYAKIRRARQAGNQLSGEINISLKWKGFPTPVTSAVSVPNSRKTEGFDYFVISWPRVYNIKITGDLPTLAAPASSSSQQNEIRSWLDCP